MIPLCCMPVFEDPVCIDLFRSVYKCFGVCIEMERDDV